MPETTSLWAYFILVLGVIVLPGMDMAYVLASALAGGRASGWAAVAGIVAGGLVHILLGGLGLGLLILAAPGLLQFVALAGAGYMFWIGWTVVRRASAPPSGPAMAVQARLPEVFARGLLTCLLNPKAYLFVVAVLPQFIHPDRGSLLWQSAALAGITAGVQVAVYGALAGWAGHSSGWLRSSPTLQAHVVRGIGAMMMVLACAAAWQAGRGVAQ